MQKRQKMTKEQLDRRRDAAFRRKIKTIFTSAGFTHLNTMNKHQKIGLRDIEVDAVFIYENVLLICEDTGSAAKDKDHIRKKDEAFGIIREHIGDFLKWLCDGFPEHRQALGRYEQERYQVFNLYISQNELNLTNDERALYSDIRFIEPQTLNYFHRITQCIKLSARYEIFRFLGLKKDDVGLVSSDSGLNTFKAPIICPKDYTGLKNGVRIVSFMMSAEKLLKTCYVMRKDNWEESIWLYQRLIDYKKINLIRKFLVDKGEAFFNNIIVALPDSVCFQAGGNHYASIDKVANFENCELVLPEEWNSVCVIDGQHRIFAHYEGPPSDKLEKKVAGLRPQLHLLVTGLVFPPKMPPLERTQIQSEIFLDINWNAKSVPTEILQHIGMVKDPFSDTGLARRVIERLNREQVFLNKFELTSLGEPKIKVTSIVSYALRYLVTLKPTDGRTSLYAFWDGDKEAMSNKDEAARDAYIDFCTAQLRTYFSAVKNRFSDAWHDPNSKILSVTSLNGFILAYLEQLEDNGVCNYEFYESRLKELEVDFSKEEFPYVSSQYKKFSMQILREAFTPVCK